MKNKVIKHGQQGDVILRRLAKLPVGEQKRISKGKCVLAHGESGHSHVIEDDSAELIAIGERMLLTLEKTAVVKHEEHGPLTLTPGVWEVTRKREHDWLQALTRPVID